MGVMNGQGQAALGAPSGSHDLDGHPIRGQCRRASNKALPGDTSNNADVLNCRPFFLHNTFPDPRSPRLS